MQYGSWQRSGFTRKEGLMNKELCTGREEKMQEVLTTMPLRDHAGEGGD